MSRFRFSLLGLAGLVAVIAVGCAALAYASSRISGVVWFGTFLILGLGTLGALLRTQPNRSWWLGFATLGWLYVLTLVGPFAELNEWLQVKYLLEKTALRMPKAMSTISPPVNTDPFGGASMGMAEAMHGSAMFGAGDVGMGMGGMATGPYLTQNTDYVFGFIRTSQALLTLLLACLGGFAGRWMYERNRIEHGM